MSLYNKYNEKFWLDDLTELYKDGKYVQFVPKYNMKRVEQLNSITRFCIYLIILLTLFKQKQSYLYVPVTIIVLTVIFYNVNKHDPNRQQKELSKILSTRQQDRDIYSKIQAAELKHDDDDGIQLEPFDPPKNIEASFIDSNGDLISGKKLRVPIYSKNPDKTLFEIDEIRQFNKETARKPTPENPFMNPSVTDYNNGDPPAASNADDDEIKESVHLTFNTDLFRDVDELWERKNSQRQFYTVPNTSVPNNQTEFAKWLWHVPQTCKTDQGPICLRYDDLKRRRN